MSWPSGWALAAERAAAARLVLVLGDTDTGKTSLVSHLTGALAARGHAVGAIDADLGQSQIGPPTALGLGRVTGPIAALGDAEWLALSWVGGTSPPGLEDALWAGVRRLADRGVALGLRPILVDTGGLVLGPVGRRVALGTARSLRPDLVICLQRTDECESLLAALDDGDGSRDGWRPDVLRLPVAAGARRRSAEERRAYREGALERYLAGSATLELPMSALRADAAAPDGASDTRDVAAELASGIAGELANQLDGRLVGLLADDGETVGIGRIAGVDTARGRVAVETPWRGAVARALVGRERFRPAAVAR